MAAAGNGMSERPKQPFADMMWTARLLVAKLEPACERIEIAGSLRRERPQCSDIELVAIPKPILNLIGEPTARTEVDDLLDTLPVTFTKRGRRYQQFHFDGTTLPFYVDLFLQTKETWGVNFLLRTGSANFSHFVVTPTWMGGHKPAGFEVKDARVWRNGIALDTPEEIDVFNAFGMLYVEPRDRA